MGLGAFVAALLAVPVVNARAYCRCQAQISHALQLLGEPNALISRSTQGCASDSAVPELVVTPKATASGPLSAATRRSAAAVSLSASSQEIATKPGSGAPFGAVRRSGVFRRLAECAISGAALPFGHNALPVG